MDTAKKIGASSMGGVCMICMLMIVGEDIPNMRAPIRRIQLRKDMLARTDQSAGQSSSDAYKTGLSPVTLSYGADHKRNPELCATLGEFGNID
jgi:hypothetical protein